MTTKEKAEKSYARYAIARDAAGKTDYAVAKEANISPTGISEWKSGKATPKADRLLRIASILNIHIEDIIGEIVEDEAI